MEGSGFVGGDLIVDDVRAGEFGDQLASAAGRADAAHFETVAPDALDFGEALLHGLDGAAGGAQVDIVDDGAQVVDDDDVGGDGADIEAEVDGDLLIVGRRHVDSDAIAQLHDVLGR
jgi:hypothetical protein